jgi:uncharacterized membrane protein (UPF0182 family)
LIYVRPLYLRASGGRIPELTRVIVAYQNQIVMEETLEAGLRRLFGAGAARETDVQLTRGPAAGGAPDAARAIAQPAAQAGGDPLEALAAQARGHYDRAVEAQRNGDWAKYGEELRMLGEVLARMRQQ